MNFGLFLIFLVNIVEQIHGHGRLIEPPSRASAWRYGFDTPHNYNDHELYCGGFTRQWVKNGGKCGICGDAWDAKTPRPHDYGGTYGQGVIVRKYAAGATVTIRVELTANHNGYFEFSICPNYQNPTQECLNKNRLKLAKYQEDTEHLGYRYFPKEGNKVYEMKYKIPKKTCEHCVLQWRYIAGNNWGNCPNGTGAVGCGPQEEFRACADIKIVGKGAEEPMVSEEPTTYPVSTSTLRPIPTSEKPTSEESFSPITTFIISIISFLVVCLIFCLLYFHFYQVGKVIRNWMTGPPKEKNNFQNVRAPPLPPQAPPRAKRSRSPDIFGYNIRKDSLA